MTVAEVIAALSSTQEAIDGEIKSIVYPISKFFSKRCIGHYYLSTFLVGEKLSLIGDKDEFEKTVE